jgi:murein DD-endopeptidase MepM/ murein hydrolase activator NlpD
MGNRRRTARSALVRVLVRVLVAGFGSALLAVSAPGAVPASVARVDQLAPGARPATAAPGPPPATAAPGPGPTQPPRTEGTGGYVEPAARFGWPLAPAPTVSRPFQPPSEPYGPGHRGVDLIGTEGQPVLAAGDGAVVYAGPLADRGVVSIDHPNGLRTSYEPVRASVRAGQLVRRGEPVGTLAAGHLGCRTETCLHWGLRRDGQYLDPLLLVRRVHVRLLPWPSDADPGS